MPSAKIGLNLVYVKCITVSDLTSGMCKLRYFSAYRLDCFLYCMNLRWTQVPGVPLKRNSRYKVNDMVYSIAERSPNIANPVETASLPFIDISP